MKNEVQKQEKPQISISNYNGSKSLMPNNIDEAYRIAQAFSKSSFIPRHFQGKEADCFAAINLGMEVGLPPMRSLQSIALVNGTPCIYGDAQLALVKASRKLVHFKEYCEGSIESSNLTAICELRRDDEQENTIEKFTMADAKKAKLWDKAGTWSTHPKRMLRYKARAFALRDKFADVLLGLTHSLEEMEGEEIINVTPSKTANIPENLTFESEVEESKEFIEKIDGTQGFYDLVKAKLEGDDSSEDKMKFFEANKQAILGLSKEQNLALHKLAVEQYG